MQERKYHAVLTAVRAAVALAALVPGPGLAAGPDVSDAVDMDSAEIFFESANGFIEGDMPDKRVFVAFSRRDGKSFAGMAWLPWKRGTFPRTLYIDTSRLTVKDNAIGGSLTLIAEGAPKHIYTLAGRIDGDELVYPWREHRGERGLPQRNSLALDLRPGERVHHHLDQGVRIRCCGGGGGLGRRGGGRLRGRRGRWCCSGRAGWRRS